VVVQAPERTGPVIVPLRNPVGFIQEVIAILDDQAIRHGRRFAELRRRPVDHAFISGGEAADRLAIYDQGAGDTNITLLTTNVYYGTNLLGGLEGGAGPRPVVHLNTNATPTNCGGLINCVTLPIRMP